MRVRFWPAPLLLTLTSCLFARYQDSGVLPKPPEVVRAAVIEALTRQEFVLTTISFDRIEATQVHLSPMYQSGIRRRATVKVDPGAASTIVHVMVEKELNCNIANPMAESEADWGKGDFDEEMEDLLLHAIQEKVAPTTLPPGTVPTRRP